MSNKENENSKNIILYEAGESVRVDVRFEDETVWLSQAQLVVLFNKGRQTIGEHIQNVFKEEELDQNSVSRKFRLTAEDGKTYEVGHYNLDVIISVGYRVKSKEGTDFRIWATKRLREHILKGFTVNPDRIRERYAGFQAFISDVRDLLPGYSSIQIDSGMILDLVSTFADTWLSLDAYDRDTLAASGATTQSVSLTADILAEALLEFKSTLIEKGEATDIFGLERQKESLAGIIGNVMQSFGGADVYPTVEEKAAHLLYFVVKNHPFVDGNKRSGAYSFVWFLKFTNILDVSKISSSTLTVLTLLVAESHPLHKDRLIRLILQLLK